MARMRYIFRGIIFDNKSFFIFLFNLTILTAMLIAFVIISIYSGGYIINGEKQNDNNNENNQQQQQYDVTWRSRDRISKDDVEIDDERAALRHREKYNLIEEHGDDWKKMQSTLCTIEYANSNRLEQDHPCVIELIRRHFLREPAPLDVPLNLTFPDRKNPSVAQSQAVLKLLGNLTNGFFVESGGYDGEGASNTLYMERYLNWTGILIEPDNSVFPQLMTKKRKSWALPVCLSLEPYPTQVLFNNTISANGIIMVAGDNRVYSTATATPPKEKPSIISVQCFPLYSILLAVNRTSIDYLSLDVEGHELRILKTVPWYKLNVKMASVEWPFIGDGEQALNDFMTLHGFVRFGSITGSAEDIIFIKDYLEEFRQYE